MPNDYDMNEYSGYSEYSSDSGFDTDTVDAAKEGGKADLSGYAQAANVAGGLFGIYGTLEAGKQAYKSKFAQALQFEEHANTALAVAQREASETRRQTGLVQSRIIALAASSGASASDPGVMNLIANQQGRGAMKAAIDMYNGEDASRTLKLKAMAAREEGRNAKKASQIAAVGQLFSTGASAFAM